MEKFRNIFLKDGLGNQSKKVHEFIFSMVKLNGEATKSLVEATLMLARVLMMYFGANPTLINHPQRKEYNDSCIKQSLISINNEIARLQNKEKGKEKN